MTYIEFFDKSAIDNIGSCLTRVPDRLIFIGDNSKKIKKHIAHYERVFSERGHNVEFIVKTITKTNLDKTVELLSEIVETYDDCVFDITGGEEMLIFALGIVCGVHPDKDIQVHKINIRNGVVYDYDKDSTTTFQDEPMLSVEENIRIYGGDVQYGEINEQSTYKWDLNDEFLEDIEHIWNICKGDVRLWNMQIGILEMIDDIGALSSDGLTVRASRAALEHCLLQRRLKYKKAKGLITALLKNGLLTHFDDEDETTVTVSFKNVQVKKCLTKAGQALEMKVYVTAQTLLDNDGAPVYNDVLNGVVIDWDGKMHDEENEKIYDTENEIDVLMMHGIVPVFVSCKNGVVTSDELYKLDAVADRFGGQYARKVLIATSLDCMGKQGNYLRQRAQDMNIQVLEKIQNMDDEELARKIKNFWGA